MLTRDTTYLDPPEADECDCSLCRTGVGDGYGHDDEEGGLVACPCFRIRLEGFEADGHCWRVSCTPLDDGLGCVHVRGDQAAGYRLKELLDAMDWYGPWTLHFGDDCR